MSELVSRSLATDRFTTSLLGGFTLAALLLAVAGRYGVVSYSVNSRVREMGPRIALGAQSNGIRRLVLRWSLTLTGGGITVGAAGALGLTRLLDGLLFEVPTIRATRLDPITVVQTD